MARASVSSFPVEGNLLVVLTGSLGDIVRGLALPVEIKNFSPAVRITWLTDSKWSQLIELHPFIDQVIVFDRSAGLGGLYQLSKELREAEFDIVLDLQRHFKSGLLSWLSRAPRRIGFHRANSKEGNWLFNTETVPVRPSLFPKWRHYLSFLEQLGVDLPVSVDFGVLQLLQRYPLSDSKIARELESSDKPRVGVLLGSSAVAKDWPTRNVIAFVREAQQVLDASVILLGDRSQVSLADQVMKADGVGPGILNLVGSTTLLDLAHVLNKLDVCVGPDSGPGHLCAAVDTPYVSLFGPSEPERVAPYGCEQYVIRKRLGCAPCCRKVCPGLGTMCMKLIGSGEVLSVVSDVLNSDLLVVQQGASA